MERHCPRRALLFSVTLLALKKNRLPGASAGNPSSPFRNKPYCANVNKLGGLPLREHDKDVADLLF